MSRCHETDALLEAVFTDAQLSRAQAAHLAACAECAHLLSQARRFDTELGSIGLDLTPEPMPAAAELLAVTAPIPRKGSPMTWKRNLIGAALAAGALVFAISALGGRGLAPGAGRAAPSVGPLATPDPQLNAWLDEAVGVAWKTSGREGTPRTRDFVRVEQCGDLYTVLFVVEPAPADYFWATGPKEDGTDVQAGVSDAQDAAALAHARATATLECARVVDTTVPPSEVVATVHEMGGLPDRIALTGKTMLTPEIAVAVMEGPNSDGNYQRWIGLLRRQDDRWISLPQQWIGTNIPANDGFTPFQVRELDRTLGSNEIIVGSLPIGATSLELIVDGTVYRYEADPGSRGIVVVSPRTPVGRMDFRVLDASGAPLSTGQIIGN